MRNAAADMTCHPDAVRNAQACARPVQECATTRQDGTTCRRAPDRAARARGFAPAPRPSRGAFSRAGGSAARARGFTLIEIMLVMTIIAATIGLTVGLLGVGRSGQQLREATHTMAAELRYTRSRALTTGEPQRFEMDLDTRAWTAAGAHHGTLPASLKVTFDGVRQEQPAARKAAIRFFPDGSATGGRISLRTQGVGWRVDVRWLTGEVTQARLPDAPQ